MARYTSQPIYPIRGVTLELDAFLRALHHPRSPYGQIEVRRVRIDDQPAPRTTVADAKVAAG